MSNSYFKFKQFTIQQDKCAMKVTTDGCLFGAWVSSEFRVRSSEFGVQSSEFARVLDIGTGTGLLSLMLAQQNNSFIDAMEIDKAAAEQATQNVRASPWAERIQIIHADANKFRFRDQYDVIISNPPFYENELKGEDAKKNLAHHDVGLSLPELLLIINNNLKTDGRFYLLLPYKRNEEIKKLLVENNLAVLQIVFVSQSTHHGYFRIMLEGKLKKMEADETSIDEISIKDENGLYTPAFVTLLKDYYLHL